jgi:capsular exopolysaccharide synthesis family protein
MLQRLSSMNTFEAPEPDTEFDPRQIVGFVWRHWAFIASMIALTLVVAAAYILKQTPLYTASALVLLEDQKEKTGGDAIYADTGYLDSIAMIENQLAIIRSSVFLRRVVEKENLVSDPEFGVDPSAEHPGAPASQGSGDEAIPPDVLASIEALKRAMTAARIGQGFTLSISITSTNPAKAARLANAIANAYVVEKLDARFEAAKRASAWLSDRLVDLRKQLRESEEAVAKFRVDHGFVQSASNVTLNQQQLSELNAKLLDARADLAQKKARVDVLSSIEAKGGNVQSLPDLASPALAALRQQDSVISQKEADLVARYNDRHPLVVNVRAERRDVQRAIAAESQRLAANVRNEYELAKAKVDTLEKSFRELTGQTGIDDKTAITLRELERTAAVNKNLFEDFLKKAKITQEQSSFQAREARIITSAIVPTVQSYPNKTRFMSVAFVIGLLLGIGGAAAKEKLNAGFVTSRQAEEMLQLPLLASVQRMPGGEIIEKGKPIKIPMLPALLPLSRYSEAIRTLRSGIQMTDVDHPPKVIQVTSTVPGEGKSTIAISLAVSAAASGLRVLLIDGDLRHPSGSKFFELHKEAGLVDMLVGNADVQSVIKYQEQLKLYILPAGSRSRNPSDLLGSERMKVFLDHCRESFDLVVVDTPPIGPVSDPITVSLFADKVVFVVRWASTARELVQQSIKQLGGHKKVAGVVFNLVNEKLAQKYGKYSYSYYYGARDYRKYYSG